MTQQPGAEGGRMKGGKPLSVTEFTMKTQGISTGYSGRLHSLEVGRGIAALLVCLYHYSGYSLKYFGDPGVSTWFRGGHAGVGYFFVLSGFIIFWIHRADIGISHSVLVFFKKRFVRLYPIYWVIFVPVALMMFLIPGLGDEKNLTISQILLDMFLLPREGDLVIPPTWTLHRELLFYVLFGIYIWKPKPGFVLLVLWQISCLLNGIFQFTPSSYRVLENVVIGPQNLGFGFGVIVAWVLSRLDLSRKLSIFLATVGSVVFLTLLIGQGYAETYSNDGLHPVKLSGWWRVGFFLSSFIMILGLVSIEKHASLHIPVWLSTFGGASYVLYLIHLPAGSVIYKILSITQIKPYINPNFAFIIGILCVVLAAVFMHVFIEKPTIKFGRRLLLSTSGNMKG